MPRDLAVVAIGPGRQVVLRPRVLSCPGDIQAMFAVEIMVATEIQLVSVDICAESENIFDAFRSPDPGVVTRIEAVMLSEIVWNRHLRKDLSHQPAGIKSRTQWIPRCKHSIHITAKYVE